MPARLRSLDRGVRRGRFAGSKEAGAAASQEPVLGVAVLAEDAFNLDLDGRPALEHVKASLSRVPGVVRVDFLRGSWLKALACVELGDFERFIFHAADRPFLSSARLSELLALAQPHPVAVPAVPVTDTYKVVRSGRIESTPRREGLMALQAPWFLTHAALEQLRRSDMTSAGSVSELCRSRGLQVALLRGDPANIRLRSAADGDLIRWAWQQAK